MLYSNPGEKILVLYHRKTPRHNWIEYCHTSDQTHFDRLLAGCKRDTAYWQSEYAQIATGFYTVPNNGVLDVPDNIRQLSSDFTLIQL